MCLRCQRLIAAYCTPRYCCACIQSLDLSRDKQHLQELAVPKDALRLAKTGYIAPKKTSEFILNSRLAKDFPQLDFGLRASSLRFPE